MAEHLGQGAGNPANGNGREYQQLSYEYQAGVKLLPKVDGAGDP